MLKRLKRFLFNSEYQLLKKYLESLKTTVELIKQNSPTRGPKHKILVEYVIEIAYQINEVEKLLENYE
jgi:primosomal protein N''